jgi:hypothetical protein
MFNTAPKAPTKKTSHVLNVFTKTLDELEQVATQHDDYAVQQAEIARSAQDQADTASAEARYARENIAALNKALGR